MRLCSLVEMRGKQNCWEFMECGRAPGGPRADELGVCPAATEDRYDGVNGGTAAGRFCWSVAGVLCRRTLEGTHAKELRNCFDCPFYTEVERAEGEDVVLLPGDVLK